MQEQETERKAPKKTFLYARIERSDKPPKLVLWLLDKGLVKSYGSANVILVLVAIIFFSVGFWFAWNGNLFGSGKLSNGAFVPEGFYNMKNSSTSLRILPGTSNPAN